jgi:glutathione peroxidase
MFRLILYFFLALFCMTEAYSDSGSFYDLKAISIDGVDTPLREFSGKVVLVVNVASNCGYTTQYAGLQRLYTDLKDRGFVIIGFPSNDFGSQEPGTNSEIKAFCSNTYGVTFPMFSKIPVRGDSKHPVYKFLTHNTSGSEVGWNFEKFLVNRKGTVVRRFPSSVSPSSQELLTAINAALEEQ